MAKNVYLIILCLVAHTMGDAIELLQDVSFENISSSYWSNPMGLKTDLISDQLYDELGPRTGKYYAIFKFDNQGSWLEQKVILPQSHTASFNLSFWYWALPGTTAENFIVEFDENTRFYVGNDLTVNFLPYTMWSVEITNQWTNIESVYERTKTIKLISNSTRSIFGLDDITLQYYDTRDDIFKVSLIIVFSLIGLMLSYICYSRVTTSKRLKRWARKRGLRVPCFKYDSDGLPQRNGPVCRGL